MICVCVYMLIACLQGMTVGHHLANHPIARFAFGWFASHTHTGFESSCKSFITIMVMGGPFNDAFCFSWLLASVVFGFRGFWLLWLLVFVAFVAFGFRGFCGFGLSWLSWLLWLLAFVASGFCLAFGFRCFPASEFCGF